MVGSLRLFDTFREQFGFVPAVFRGQTLLPRLIEAESVLLAPILFQDNALVRAQKELVLLALAAARGNCYCFALHYQMLRLLGAPERRIDRVLAGFQRADLAPANLALITLTQMLGKINPLISEADVDDARSHGLTDETLLEAVLTAALSRLLCTLSTGVGAEPDFASRLPAPPAVSPVQDGRLTGEIEQSGFYIHAPELSPTDSAPFLHFCGISLVLFPASFAHKRRVWLSYWTLTGQAARTGLRSGRSVSSIAGPHRSLRARARSCTMC